MSLDETDTKILKHLLVDARQSSRQLAHKLGISTVTIISRLRKLEQGKVVKGYSARLDQEILGYDITAIIEVTTRKGKMLEIEDDWDVELCGRPSCQNFFICDRDEVLKSQKTSSELQKGRRTGR